MIWVMSSERMAMVLPLGGGVRWRSWTSVARSRSRRPRTRAVDESVADADLEAAEQAGVDGQGELDALAGHGHEARLDGGHRGGVERARPR